MEELLQKISFYQIFQFFNFKPKLLNREISIFENSQKHLYLLYILKQNTEIKLWSNQSFSQLSKIELLSFEIEELNPTILLNYITKIIDQKFTEHTHNLHIPIDDEKNILKYIFKVLKPTKKTFDYLSVKNFSTTALQHKIVQNKIFITEGNYMSLMFPLLNKQEKIINGQTYNIASDSITFINPITSIWVSKIEHEQFTFFFNTSDLLNYLSSKIIPNRSLILIPEFFLYNNTEYELLCKYNILNSEIQIGSSVQAYFSAVSLIGMIINHHTNEIIINTSQFDSTFLLSLTFTGKLSKYSSLFKNKILEQIYELFKNNDQFISGLDELQETKYITLINSHKSSLSNTLCFEYAKYPFIGLEIINTFISLFDIKPLSINLTKNKYGYLISTSLSTT